MEVERTIFHTPHRGQHGRAVSYPLGAEAISRALDGVPQHGIFTCSFQSGSLEQDLAKSKLYVLTITYSKHAASFNDGRGAAERGVFDPRWEVTVFTVPTPLRHQIRIGLLGQVLPEIVRPWVVTSASITGKTGGCGLTIEYNTLDQNFISTARSALIPDKA
jgi:hypothetical protein